MYIKFKDHLRTSTFNDAVDKLPFDGGHTRIDKALRLAQRDMFTHDSGARIGVNRVLLLLTDGSQTWVGGSEDPITVAEEIRNSGIHIMVIGIGDEVDVNELKGIAGSDKNIFTGVSFDEVITSDFVEKISSSTCNGSKY